jgi:hypothetical protein
MMSDEHPASPKSKGTRSRSAVKKSTAPGEVIAISGQAEQGAEELRAKLVGMLDSAALMRANRRRATAIDQVDFEAAFDDVVHPVSKLKRLALIGDVCGIFGAGFIGYSINIYTGAGSIYQIGHIAILAGMVLSVAGACLKYLDPSR